MSRILVIDDDPAVLRSVSRLLKFEGHSVRTFQDPSELYTDPSAPHDFDAIVTDLEMGAMGGEDVLRYLRVRSYPLERTVLHSSHWTAPYVAKRAGVKFVAKGEGLLRWLEGLEKDAA